MIAYPVKLTPDDGTLLVTCPALPEVTTFGDDKADALRHAADAIEEALAARIAEGADIPEPTGKGTPVRVSAQSAIKVELYRLLRQQGLTRADLQRRLGWNRESVDRLFRLGHNSRLEQLETAFGALGRQLDVAVKEDA